MCSSAVMARHGMQVKIASRSGAKAACELVWSILSRSLRLRSRDFWIKQQ